MSLHDGPDWSNSAWSGVVDVDQRETVKSLSDGRVGLGPRRLMRNDIPQPQELSKIGGRRTTEWPSSDRDKFQSSREQPLLPPTML
jgi:hypothetical protein